MARGDLSRGRTVCVRFAAQDASAIRRAARRRAETDSEWVRRVVLERIAQLDLIEDAPQRHAPQRRRRRL